MQFSRTTGPYFLYQDLINRSRVITHLGKPFRASRKILPGHWKGIYAHYTPIFFLSRSAQQEPCYNASRKTLPGHWKGIYAHYTPIFFLSRSAQQEPTKKNLTGVVGKGSSRPTRPYFFYQDLTNRSRVIKNLGKPDRDRWKGVFAHYTPIFFLSRSDQQEPSYNAPGKAAPEPLERALRYRGKPDRGRWKGLFAPYMPIVFLSRSEE
ncbi:hypothetical protein V1477_017768 [Vespula maculifrons]|uniref:Uncharacterized protein n=1 Tax=Vespula maculifrons TaxID=7453 RepID=A0ABD2B0F9_VESMC